MIIKLRRQGDEYAIVLDRSAVDELGLDADSSIEAVAQDGVLFVRKAGQGALPADFTERVERINREWSPVFKKLAE